MITTPEEINQNRGTSGWLELYDLSLHGDMDSRLPIGAHIRGMIGEAKKFAPTSEILGKAIPKPEGMNRNPGWVELETLQFHRDLEAVAPIPPYVHGEMDENNHFYPDEPYLINQVDTSISVHYQSWTDEITIENKHIKHVHTEYEYDNPVSGNPSGSEQSVLTDTDLTEQQWEGLKNYIQKSEFEQLEDSYGAPEETRYYPYSLTIGWGTEKKEVKYRSNPSYGEAPLAFKNIEKYLFTLSKEARQ